MRRLINCVLSATAALVERKDVIVIASVSCIYGLGSPEDYLGMMVSLRPGMEKDRDEVIRAAGRYPVRQEMTWIFTVVHSGCAVTR